ncbi:hypothetical protein NPS70_07380 [Streptomyces sp. C10-9-1]|uniref:hypothetical protein n=1 Tax=Streptomyces sp. C10-9-1 TaxID=1859285 RepID=UPI0021133DC3|nr:hypothetical protein [Streptomyces sp. C10-9-1]MCQ6553020.1 hypothetical protein [Streptomyces sp. C10-9-1]
MRRRHGATAARSAAAAGLLLVAACGTSGPEARDRAPAGRVADPPASASPTCEISEEKEPVGARFSALGEVLSTRWCAFALGTGTGRVPGPTDTRVVGYFETSASAVEALLGRSGWTFEETRPTGLPDAVARAAGITPSSTTTWVTSPELDGSVTRDLYTGSFYLDEEANRILFDTVNPVDPEDGVVVVGG